MFFFFLAVPTLNIRLIKFQINLTTFQFLRRKRIKCVIKLIWTAKFWVFLGFIFVKSDFCNEFFVDWFFGPRTHFQFKTLDPKFFFVLICNNLLKNQSNDEISMNTPHLKRMNFIWLLSRDKLIPAEKLHTTN